MTVPDLSRAALWYADRGWPVLPVEPAGKRPLARLVPHGLHDASTDPATVARWWSAEPRANIGIALDGAAGMVAVDVDGAAGRRTLAAILGEHEPLPRTVQSWTGREDGGVHLIFRAPSGTKTVKRGGLELRGEGSYIVVAPSIHASGRRYSWHKLRRPDRYEPAELPAWLAAALAARPTAPRAAPRDSGDGRDGGPIPEGSRNDTLTSLAGAMRRRGRAATEIEAALAAVNSRRCVPPLDEAEVRRIAGSVTRYPPGPATIPAPSAGGNGTAPAPGGGETTPQEWGDPLPLVAVPELPPFPFDVLPDWMAAWVRAEAEATQTPPALAGSLALAAVGAGAAGKYMLVPRPGWSEQPNIYTVIALPPANRKSAVYRDALAPVEEIERELIRELAPAVAEKQARRRTAEKALAHAESLAAKGKATPEDVAQAARELAATPRAAMPRLLAGDATPEVIVRMLSEQDGRLLVASAEGGGPFAVAAAGRYSRDGEANMEALLAAHAGDTIRVDRVGRDSDHVAHPALTLALTIQPDVLRTLGERPEFRARGLLGRVLFSIPDSPLGHRLIRPAPVPAEIAAAYRRGVRAVWELLLDHDGDGPAPRVIRFTAEADDLLAVFERELEPRLGPGGDLAAVADLAGKLAGAVVRLAGILHLADEPRPDPDPIPGVTVARAAELGRYYLAHGQAAYGALAVDPARELAEAVLVWLRRHGAARVTRRDVHQSLRGRAAVQRVEDLDPALDLLAEYGWVRPADGGADRGPGRPSPAYDVHPDARGGGR